MKNKTLVVGAGMFMLLAAVSFVGAESSSTSSNPMKVVIGNGGNIELAGTLASISGTMLTINSWHGAWMVEASSSNLLSGNSDNNGKDDGKKITLSDLQVGDRIAVEGRIMTASAPWTITARKVHDYSAILTSISGTVSNLNSGAQTFTLTRGNGTTLTVFSSSSTKVSVDGQAAAFGNLAEGMKASVSGVWGSSHSSLLARRIVASHQTKTFSGTLSSPNAATMSFGLKTEDHGTVTVSVSASTTLVVNGKGNASFADLKDGMKAGVSGTWNSVQNTLVANKVNASGERVSLGGTIATSSIGAASFTLNTSEGLVLVSGNASTSVYVDGVAASFADLHGSMKATVYGFWGDSGHISITATQVRAHTLLVTWSGTITMPAVGGTIPSIPTPQYFMFATADHGTVTVTVTSTTKLYVNGVRASFADFVTGMSAQASGSYNTDSNILAGSQVRARTSTTGASVTSTEDKVRKIPE